MLLTIIDTKSYGKFVLHLFPYQPLNPPKQDVTPLQLTQSLMTAFQYFGIYQKSNVISTSNGNLKEGTVVQILSANQKYTQIVMGLDQNCVLISKSVFLDPSRQLSHNFQYPPQHMELGQFISLNDSDSSIINSVSLAYCQEDFNNLEEIKNKLAFLVSALEIKQKHSKYLSKQIFMIIEQRNQFKKVLKDKCSVYQKQNNTIFQQFKIKMIYKEIQTEANAIIKKINIFQLLQKIYNAWDKKELFKPQLLQDEFLSGINGANLNIPSIHQAKQKIKHIQNKTFITVPPKLNSLPPVFYPNQRIQYIYQRLLSNNSKPFRNVITNQLQMSADSIYHTINFLLCNDLCLSVCPFDSDKYYPLYTLRTAPDKKVIQKFKSLFQGEDILEYLKKFEKYYRVKVLDQKVKYLLLNKMIKQVSIYIEKLEPVENQRSILNQRLLISDIKDKKLKQIKQKQKEKEKEKNSINYNKNNQIEVLLNRYVSTKPQEINFILNKCRDKNIKMNQLINFVKNNINSWKFIFIQN